MNRHDRDDLVCRLWFVVGAVVMLALGGDSESAVPRAASYASQRSDGSPLVVRGVIDTARVQFLARFDDVTLNIVPWVQDVNGAPRADVPLMLRRLNPGIRLWLYVSMDPWLPQDFRPQPWDQSGYRDVFTAMAAGNGFLYGTDGARWHVNYGLNAGDYSTMWRVGDVLTRMVRLRLVDGIFMDNLSPSITWTSNSARPLDVERAGFRSLAAMDSARAVNIETLIKRLHAAGGCGFLVAMNGTGPKPAGLDVDFMEGLGILPTSSVAAARAWMRTPGIHWLMADTWGDCAGARTLLRSIAAGSRSRAIISAGPATEWPPCPTYPDSTVVQ